MAVGKWDLRPHFCVGFGPSPSVNPETRQYTMIIIDKYGFWSCLMMCIYSTDVVSTYKIFALYFVMCSAVEAQVRLLILLRQKNLKKKLVNVRQGFQSLSHL